MKRPSSIILAICLLSPVALAQPASQPAKPSDDAARAGADNQPQTSEAVKAQPPAPTTTDAEIKAALGMLVGSFAAKEADGQPALRLNASYINVEGLDNAVYFELARADSPAHPFRQGVFHILRRKGDMALRVCEFGRVGPSFGGMLTGLWAAPEALPALKADQLVAVADIPLAKDGAGYRATTATAVPTMIGGAIEFTSTINLAAGGVRFADRGFDASGKQVWGPGDGKATVFERCPVDVKVENRGSGLIVIDLIPAKAGEAPSADGSDLALHYTGWTIDGFQFDTSRLPNREPLRMMLPGALIPGFNSGIPGIAKGVVRKLIIPGALGYGERGNPRAKIAPNTTLVFEVECVYHRTAQERPRPKDEDGVSGQDPIPTPPPPPKQK